MTTNPANLKKYPLNHPLTTAVIPPIPKSPGIVPKANKPIIRPPRVKLPVLTAYNCIAWVKPQGKKNVATPVKKESLWLYSFVSRLMPKKRLILLGKVKPPKRGKTSISFNPRKNITIPTITINVPRTELEKRNAEPAKPITPPKKMYETMRPALKNRWGRNF